MAGQLTAFDIGESMVKIVSVSGGQVKKGVCAQMPDNLVSDGVILFNDAMADTLKATLSSAGMGKGKSAVILPDRLVFSRNVAVPPMTEAQLRYNLPFEFKDYLTQEKSQYYFDYSVQEILKEGEEPKEMRLFACATLKQTIEQYRTVLRLAGCKLVNAIPEEVAYGSLVARYIEGRPEEADLDYCLVDVGYRGLRMYIYRGSEFRNRRTVDLGLYDLEREISESRGVDIHVAHTHLMTDYQQAQTLDASQELYNRMAVEIMKSVNFYNYNNRDRSLHRICLCGGGGAILPLREAIARMTDLEIMPVSDMIPGADKLEEPWLYARAVGCALQK